jgi:hypothetical protein
MNLDYYANWPVQLTATVLTRGTLDPGSPQGHTDAS